jgi:cyclopropane fatty-acyl-phospholipid synthase-like methyltransferase
VDRRAFSQSTARNRVPILAALRRVLPEQGKALEIASGTGEHAVHFARALPGLVWQTSDSDTNAHASIEAWIAHERLANVLPPLVIDVRAKDWGLAPPLDAVVAINMIHIAPWDATPALFEGAARLSAATVFLYGPFQRGGAHTASSNEAFDKWLKDRDPLSGVRNLENVVHEAASCGFRLHEALEMPANNLSLIFGAAC